jgi:hypothetical protein
LGGYLPEENFLEDFNNFQYQEFLLFKSGRSCLHFLLSKLKPIKIHLPYYCCNSVIQPLQQSCTSFSFYQINSNFEPVEFPNPGSKSIFLYINYFGLKNSFLNDLENIYKENLWVDNTQAFYATYNQTSKKRISFNSSRKFFGVPDGAMLRSPFNTFNSEVKHLPRNNKLITEHLKLSKIGKQEEGFTIFQSNEHYLGYGLERISEFSESLHSKINYTDIAKVRRNNFKYLHSNLKSKNKICPQILDLSDNAVPNYYPFLPEGNLPHQSLWNRKVYAPVLWNDCLTRSIENFEFEKSLCKILPLPIDQRYSQNDMDYILKVLDSIE